MPELPEPKMKIHPVREPHHGEAMLSPTPHTALRIPNFAELQCISNFTFLTGASHPDELVQQAASLGYRALAVTDVHTLAGVVRAHVAARDAGLQFIVGSRLLFGELSITVYPTDLESYGQLCQLLTTGKRRAPKGQCHLTLHDLIGQQRGLIVIAAPPRVVDMDTIDTLASLRDVFDGDRISIAASCLYGPDDRQRLRQIADLADHLHVPLVATNDACYHHPSRRPLQDVLTCIRHGCTIEEAGHLLLPNAERHLKHPEEMARLFAEFPGAMRRTIEITDRCRGFSLDQLRYQYPEEITPPGQTPMEHLIELAWAGATEHYPGGVPVKVRGQVEHELALIRELNYAPYFLTVYDLVRFARSRGILCQGRGAAANSAVCYCLGVTSVDPDQIDVLFERFISKERNEPPDIDIDFEHERREEVIQYIYAKYGRDRAAICAEVISYRGRSAVRDVGKALGLPLDVIDRVAKGVDHYGSGPMDADPLSALGLNPADPTLRRWIGLTQELRGFPRHLSQHVGGFVITQKPLCRLVPIENAAMANRTVIEWDKDDIDAMNMLKVDVLGLGMLTCIRKCLNLLPTPLRLHEIPREDPVVYDMICRADTVGVFQIESRAQMSMLPRLRPRCFYDLVIEVAIVRPGPIQGNMVHPYLRRRQGIEPIVFADDHIRDVLGRTLGVPLFQEQAMKLAIVAAGFTPGEADQLRRAIQAWKTRGNKLEQFGMRIIEGMLKRGYSREFAEQCFEQIKGFSGYGFPESHAASFALLVYASAWLKCHHPAAFAASLLNSQPMGFYAPAQIVRDAQSHGVEVRPVDVNRSVWDSTLEHDGSADRPALRLGMSRVRGMRVSEANIIVALVREHGPVGSVTQLWRFLDGRVTVSAMRALAAADALGSMGLDRQQALWQVRALHDERLPLFERADACDVDAAVALPPIPLLRRVMQDYSTVGLSLKRHPMAFLRDDLRGLGAITAERLSDESATPHGKWVTIAGLCLLRQRPSTARGITFMTLEDETGTANLVVRYSVFQTHRAAARGAGVMLVRGRVERQGRVVHVLVRKINSMDEQLTGLVTHSRDFR